MAYQLKITEETTARLLITNKAGVVTPVQSPPAWASSDPTVLTVVASADGMTAKITSVALGTGARCSVSADADLGEGVEEIVAVTEDIDVVEDPDSKASIMTLTLDPPTPKA
jgi:uncharacterized protein YjdB